VAHHCGLRDSVGEVLGLAFKEFSLATGSHRGSEDVAHGADEVSFCGHLAMSGSRIDGRAVMALIVHGLGDHLLHLGGASFRIPLGFECSIATSVAFLASKSDADKGLVTGLLALSRFFAGEDLPEIVDSQLVDTFVDVGWDHESGKGIRARAKILVS